MEIGGPSFPHSTVDEQRLGLAPTIWTELEPLYRLKNGFVAFESALYVLPVTTSGDGPSIASLIGPETFWAANYGSAWASTVPFAADVFGDLYALVEHDIVRFAIESGEQVRVAGSLEEWAEYVLQNYAEATGWPIAHHWQIRFGPLALGERLLPKIPFVLRGDYAIENLRVGGLFEGLRFGSDLARQIRHLPDGATVKFRVQE